LTSQKPAIVASYTNGTNQTQSRAMALRTAIDNTTFTNVEYNPSFVLMQYFGYLGRDPEQGGYLFWLNVLNSQQQGNYRGMICASSLQRSISTDLGFRNSNRSRLRPVDFDAWLAVALGFCVKWRVFNRW